MTGQNEYPPPASAIQELKSKIKGTVLVREEAPETEYREAINRWNEAYTKEAGIIAFVENEEDVSNCIRFVIKHNLDVAVSGGGHSHHGASSSDEFVIDLRKMNGVMIDKAAKTATAQGGCLAKDVEAPAEAEGLSVVFGAVNVTGIGGLTTGGGVGWLTGRHGLAIDNLLSARVALADGSIVTASEEENADLFWGIRGGGCNFGVCTEFKYRAHEQGPVFFQILMFSPDKTHKCVSLMNTIHAIAIEKGEGKFQSMLALLSPPNMPLCPAYMIFYDGPEEKARELAAPLYALEPFVAKGGMMPYSMITDMPNKMQPEGHNRYATSQAQMNFPLDEDIVLGAIDEFKNVVDRHGNAAKHSKFVVDLRDYRVAASKPIHATAYANRYSAQFVIAEFQWDDPTLDKAMREESLTISSYVRKLVREKATEAQTWVDGESAVTTVYANLSNGTQKANSVFGANMPRMRELKRKFDPGCVWDKWFPIVPAEEA